MSSCRGHVVCSGSPITVWSHYPQCCCAAATRSRKVTVTQESKMRVRSTDKGRIEIESEGSHTTRGVEAIHSETRNGTYASMYLPICFPSCLLHIRVLQASCGRMVVRWCAVRGIQQLRSNPPIDGLLFYTLRVPTCPNLSFISPHLPSFSINCHQLPSIAITHHQSTHAYTRRHATAQ